MTKNANQNLKTKISNQSTQTKDAKPKIPNHRSQSKYYLKPKIPNERDQRFETKGFKAQISNQRSHTKEPEP